MERILIATDGSPSAREAVNIGLELAVDEDAAVTFVHVVHALDSLPTGGYVYVASVPHEPTSRDYAPLVDAAAIAAERGVQATTKLLRGHPAYEIVAYADSIGADLIVIGSRGHGGLTRTLLGSVSRAVLAETRRPVLVVRSSATAAVPEAEPAVTG
jgi:nucleotide-binding universal stress UspA family protein